MRATLYWAREQERERDSEKEGEKRVEKKKARVWCTCFLPSQFQEGKELKNLWSSIHTPKNKLQDMDMAKGSSTS